MHQDPKEDIKYILELLQIENKDEVAENFMLLCFKEALLNLIEQLPDDKQEALVKKVFEEKDVEKREEILKQYFSAEEYNRQIKEASESIFKSYLSSLAPALSDTQKEAITAFGK